MKFIQYNLIENIVLGVIISIFVLSIILLFKVYVLNNKGGFRDKDNFPTELKDSSIGEEKPSNDTNVKYTKIALAIIIIIATLIFAYQLYRFKEHYIGLKKRRPMFLVNNAFELLEKEQKLEYVPIICNLNQTIIEKAIRENYNGDYNPRIMIMHKNKLVQNSSYRKLRDILAKTFTCMGIYYKGMGDEEKSEKYLADAVYILKEDFDKLKYKFENDEEFIEIERSELENKLKGIEEISKM